MKGRRLRVRGPWAAVIQCSAFVRKELAEIVRQPGLILLLIVGPFVLLMMFGYGYRSDELGLRTVFVGPPDSFYEQAVDDYQEQLEQFVEPQGYTTDEAAAMERLEDGELDVVVVFPPDPLGVVLEGERAPIEVWHDKIDPIQTTAVTIAAQLAVQEINATVLAAVVSGSQEALIPAGDAIDALTTASGALGDAAGAADSAGVVEHASTVSAAATGLRTLVAQSDLVLTRLGAADDGTRADVLDRLDEVAASAGRIEDGTSNETAADAEAIAANVAAVADAMPSISALDPDVLVRPFVSETASVAPVDVTPASFFAPSSLALLLQHLAVTVAALSLVRDRDLGLFELLRVGPLSSAEIIVGKTVAYMVVGMVVGVGLLAAAVNFLDVPLVGEGGWAVASIALVLLASLALGLLISLISGSETQAVQWAMLTLLAGLFFGGFVLDLEGLTYPVKAVSWLLPVTYGIRLLQDVLLRGLEPDPMDLAGLGALVVVYGTLAIGLLRHQLRTA